MKVPRLDTKIHYLFMPMESHKKYFSRFKILVAFEILAFLETGLFSARVPLCGRRLMVSREKTEKKLFFT